MKHLLLALSSALLAGPALAQQSAWGQCGGINYTGPTNCVANYACTSQNPWYFQCVPGTAPPPLATSTHSAPSTTSATTTTTKTTPVTTTTTSPPLSTATGFAKTNGVLFDIDGETTYYASTNC